MRPTTMVPSDIRVYHRGMVLRLLRDSGPMSRAEAARRCRLSPPTIGEIVAGLLDEGLVTEIGTVLGGARLRRRTEIALAAESCEVIGVHIGQKRVRMGTCDLLGRLSIDLESGFGAGATICEVADVIAKESGRLLTAATISNRRILGLGVTVPGTVDRLGRRVELSRVLGWQDAPLADALESTLQLPVVLDNNARPMALAEARYGCVRGTGDLLYVYLGNGVDIGAVINGEAFHARLRDAPEFGHQRAVDGGERCGCGATGCLETIVSEPALARRAAALAAPGSTLAELLDSDVPPLRALEEAAEAGDHRAAAVLDEFRDTLTTALATAVSLLTPEVVAFGGALANASNETITQLRRELHARVSPAVRDAVRFERSLLGADAGVLGAGVIALDRVLYRAGEPPLR